MSHHQDILGRIKKNSNKPTKHTFLDSYLGNSHPRYPISAPELRKIAKEWMKANRSLGVDKFEKVITSLIRAKSSTEKCMAGILLDYANSDQRKFSPDRFDFWLDHLVGWAEVDAVCTGNFTTSELPGNFQTWKKLISRLSKSKNIHKRRASLVLLCSPLRSLAHEPMANLALITIERLKPEKEILITKAISWLLRSMVKHHKEKVRVYIQSNQESLPAIAIRETLTKIRTGRKGG